MNVPTPGEAGSTPVARALWPGLLSVGLLCAGVLHAGHAFAAPGEDESRAAKLAELVRLQGGRMMEQTRSAGREAANRAIRSITAQTFGALANIPPERRVAVEAASQQFLREVDSSFDRDDAVQAWGRFYAQGLTEKELDGILAYYRSPAGQADVRASQAALPQFQKYMLDRRTAALDSAVAIYTAALREIADPSSKGSTQPELSALGPTGPHPSPPGSNARAAASKPPPPASNPSAPYGKVIADSVSEHCEVPSAAASGAHNVPPSGRSVLCVCVDEQGTLTQDPLIAESSGDSRVDSGAVKLARSGSGRYRLPAADGKPQKGCFRFAINFGQQE